MNAAVRAVLSRPPRAFTSIDTPPPAPTWTRIGERLERYWSRKFGKNNVFGHVYCSLSFGVIVAGFVLISPVFVLNSVQYALKKENDRG